MHIERVPNRNSPPAVLLRQSYREGGKVLNRFKMAKHFRLEITDNSFRYERDLGNIGAEAMFAVAR